MKINLQFIIFIVFNYINNYIYIVLIFLNYRIKQICQISENLGFFVILKLYNFYKFLKLIETLKNYEFKTHIHKDSEI